jgi:hypothetical protein
MTVLWLGLVLLAFCAGHLRGMLVRRKDIWDTCGECLYLQRWFIMGRGGDDGRAGTSWALMLHRMHRPDEDRAHHDHPWNFWTLVLWGGYVEEVSVPAMWGPGDGRHYLECPARHISAALAGERRPCTCVRFKRNRMRPGTLAFRPAEYRHRIATLPKGQALTLVLRTKKRRSWGFWMPGEGWIKWKEFHRRAVEWCKE